MTKQRRQDFALGLTAIVVAGLFLGTLLFLVPALGGDGRTIEIHFRHEEGLAPLKKGSPVLLAGSVDVGRVRELRVAQLDGPDGHPRTVFVVQATLRHDIPLYGNCRITTGQPAIGGPGYVSILNVGTPGTPLVEPIQGLPAQSLAAAIGQLSSELLSEGGFVDQLNTAVNPEAEGSLMNKLLASLTDINALTRELRHQMSPSEQQALLAKIHRLADDLNATTAALRTQLDAGNDAAVLARVHAALGHLEEGLAEAAAMLKENRPVVRDTLATVRHAVTSIDQEMLGALRTELDAGNPNGTLGKLHTAMDRVNASLADVQSMTSTGQRLVAVSRPSLERTLGNFVAMSDQLKLASQEVRLNPSKLIWGPTRQREEKLLVFRAASHFAEAAGRLDDAAGRLAAVLQTLPADGSPGALEADELRSIYEAVQAAFQRFGRAEEVLWEQLK